ncbi:MAG: MATE family efflux transporter [Syntrophomonadaceae bacterium]|jgi:putative MATE family efflux protein|nr:MATE family efflux transporter [Syntrophomonadaceae bacterium]
MSKGEVFIRAYDMANGRVILVLLRLSLPAMAGMIIFAFLNLIDAFYLARLGAKELAALVMAAPAKILINSLASATGAGLFSVLGKTLGGGDYPRANNIAWHGLILSLFYSAVILTPGYLCMEKILPLLGCDAETLILSKDYLHIIFPGSVFTFILIIFGNVLQSEGNTAFPSFLILAGTFLTVLFDPFLIFGYGRLPALGLKGAAWASVLSDVICAFILLAVVRKRETGIRWRLRDFNFKFPIMSSINKVAIPVLIMELSAVFVMAWFSRHLALFGYAAVAAYGLISRVISLSQVPAYGLTQGLMPLAAYAYGSGDTDRLKAAVVQSVILSLLLLSLSWLVLQIFPRQLFLLLSGDPVLTVTAETGLCLASLFIPLRGLAAVFFVVLQALGKGATAMGFALFREVILFIPLVYYLSSVAGINGIWLGIALTDLLFCGLISPYGAKAWYNMGKRDAVRWHSLIKGGYIWKRSAAWLKF